MTMEIQTFSLLPTTFEQAMQYAKLIADSDFAPKDFKNKPSNVLIAIQMGSEVGLKPMQAIQNIAVINGRPSLWGDAMLALVKSHPEFVDIDEKVENGIAACTITRKGQTPQTRTFSLADAKKAGLIGKLGPWTNYESRMLQMRARGFAIRDVFPDAIKGLSSAEEVRDTPYTDYEVIEDKSSKKPLSVSGEISPEIVDGYSLKIKDCSTIEELNKLFSEIKPELMTDSIALNRIVKELRKARDEIKKSINKQEEASQKEIEPEPEKPADDFVKSYEEHVPAGEK